MDRFLLFVALGCAMVSGQAPEPTGSLTGKVVDATTKAGIRKVTVFATMQAPPSTPVNGVSFAQPAIYSASTDDGGSYRFSSLPSGSVNLRVEKAGYLATAQGGWQRSAVHAGDEVTVPEMMLTKQAVIAGRVTDSDGEPVERASVNAIPARRTRGGASPGNSQAITDDRGEFRLSRMAAGTYKLMATKPGADFARASVTVPGEPVLVNAPTYFPAALDAATASDITVGSGEERAGVEIRLQKAVAVRVTGRVTGELANVAGVNVSLQSFEGAGAARTQMHGFNTVAGVDGRFVFPNVFPGEYLAVANAHRTTPGPMLNGIARLRVSQQDLDQFVIPLQPMARISGKVVTEGDSKLPYQQINISISSAEPGLRGGGGAQVQQDGTFAIENIQRKRLKMDPLAPRGWYLKALSVGGQRQPSLEVDLSAGDAAIELVYSNKPGGVDVRVDGVTAESGFLMGYALPDPGNEAPPLTNLYRSVRVGTGQNVSKIEDVPPGNYLIVVCPQGLLEALSEPSIWEKVKSKAASVKVGEGVTVSASPRLIVESDVEEK